MAVIRICALLVAVGCFTSVPGTSQAAPRPNPKLIKKVTLKWEDQPVVEGIVKEIEAIGMKVSVDTAALEAEGISEASETLGPIELNAVPLYPALREIARQQMMCLISNGTELRLTSWSQANEEYVEASYSLQGIQAALTSETEFIDAIQSVGYNWNDIDGGEGSVAIAPNGSVSIKQTSLMQEEVANFFSLAELALRGRAPTYLDPKTQATLRKKFQFAPGELSLEDQIQTLLKDINYLVDRDSIAAEGYDLQTMTATPMESDTVVNHLDTICADNNLGWSVHGGIIVIQSQIAAEEDMQVRVYNVRKHITPELTPDLMAAKLMNTPELGPWLEDGEGEANCMPLGPLLVVWHHRAAHEKIAELVK